MKGRRKLPKINSNIVADNESEKSQPSSNGSVSGLNNNDIGIDLPPVLERSMLRIPLEDQRPSKSPIDMILDSPRMQILDTLQPIDLWDEEERPPRKRKGRKTEAIKAKENMEPIFNLYSDISSHSFREPVKKPVPEIIIEDEECDSKRKRSKSKAGKYSEKNKQHVKKAKQVAEAIVDIIGDTVKYSDKYNDKKGRKERRHSEISIPETVKEE